MKRLLVLPVIVGIGVAMITAGLVAQQAGQGGQAGRGGAAAGLGPIGTIQKVAERLYMIPGAGGNTAVFIMADGILIVDTKLANNGQAILDQVKSVSNKPITHIINTHTHGDHTGSNAFFPASVEIVAQENTAANMKKMPAFQEDAAKVGLPDRTFNKKMTLL